MRNTMKKLLLLLVAIATLVCGAAYAQERVQSKWVGGELIFFDSATGTEIFKVNSGALDVTTLKVGGTSVSTTAAELNKLAGVTAGTAAASKAAVLGTNKNLDTLVVADSGLKLGSGAGTAVSATATELNQYCLTVSFADAGTSGSVYVVAPHAGDVVGLAAVNHANSTTTATALTAAINGSAITHPSWTIASTATAGTASAVVPTAANAVTAGQVIRVSSDGGTDATMPASVTITIAR
jgi:CRP-like cAMP-binding protein